VCKYRSLCTGSIIEVFFFSVILSTMLLVNICTGRVPQLGNARSSTFLVFFCTFNAPYAITQKIMSFFELIPWFGKTFYHSSQVQEAMYCHGCSEWLHCYIIMATFNGSFVVICSSTLLLLLHIYCTNFPLFSYMTRTKRTCLDCSL